MISSHLTLLKGVLVIIFALFVGVKSVDPIWLHESLDNIPLHLPIDTDYLSWGSTSVFTFSGRKAINVKSVTSPTISKQFSIQIPHAELIIQAQFYQSGCFSASEGFQFEVSGVEGTYQRFSTSNVIDECQAESINTFTSRFIFPQSETSFTISFTSIFDNPNQLDKTISINDLKIGVTQCEYSCAKCHLGPSPNLTHQTICDICPENASFVPNSNLCACNANFVADNSFTYLICKPNTDVNDNQITAACRAELTNYSTRTRVNIFTSEQTINLEPKAIAHIDYFHFYQDITPSCATLNRLSALKFNSQTNAFESLGSKYIINVVNGEYIEVAFSLAEFSSLANIINHEGSKTIYSIRLALQIKVGTTVTRVHEFYLIYQLNGDNTHSVSAQNTDYQKNMNFISLSTYNSASFLKEYLFDLKRYFCTNSSCINTRSIVNFSKHEQIITKIAFKSTLTKASLVLLDAHLFGNNKSFDIKNSVSILSSGDGYLVAAFYQDFIETLVNNNQATNKVYLQFTVSYHDIPTNPLSKVRYGQVDILFYALYTGII